MFVGDRKGAILDTAMHDAAAAAAASGKAGQPLRVLELGTFLGYSALRIARILAAEGPVGSMLTTVETSARNAALARRLLEHANLPAGLVNVVEAPSSKTVQELSNGGEKFNLVFLDHHKDQYLPDARALEAGGCLAPSAVLVADNVVFPGCPGYLEWVRGCGKFASDFHEAELEYTEVGGLWEVYGKKKSEAMADGIEVSRYLGG